MDCVCVCAYVYVCLCLLALLYKMLTQRSKHNHYSIQTTLKRRFSGITAFGADLCVVDVGARARPCVRE